jgi:hypothetical protein
MTTPSGGDPGPASGGPGSLPSPLDSVDDMRATAKWMLVAAGAVGAALISGGPLVGIGQVHGALHYFFSVLGLLLALGGVGVAIWSASQVLVPRVTTPNMVRAWLKFPGPAGPAVPARVRLTFQAAWSRLRAPRATWKALTAPRAPRLPRTPEERLARQMAGLDDLRALVESDPAGFLGADAFRADTVDKLFESPAKFWRASISLSMQAAREQVPERRTLIEAYLARATDSRSRAEAHIDWLIAAAHAWRVKKALDRSRVATLAGGVLVIIGALFFFAATADSGPTYVPVLTTPPTAAATPTP